jgi:hypothetical protein
MSHHLIPCHLSLLKNIYENSRSMPHYLMPHHLSLLKNNCKNSIKSPLITSHFSLKNNSKNLSSMPHHLMSYPISICYISINHIGLFSEVCVEPDAETKYSHAGNEAFQQHAYLGMQKPWAESKQCQECRVLWFTVLFSASPCGAHHHGCFPHPASALYRKQPQYPMSIVRSNKQIYIKASEF